MDVYKVNVPVVLIIFNRPRCVKESFESIRKVSPKKLYIIADGPRQGNKYDIELCEECRKIVSNVDWDCEVIRIYAEKNMGCGLRPSSGLTEVFSNEESAIIIEDDCVPSADFFEFCEELLEYYKDTEKIYSIGGMSFGLNSNDGSDYYFSNINHTWGWATWRRVWQKYDYAISDFPEKLEDNFLKNVFNDRSVRNYFYKIFSRVMAGEITSAWDYQFLYESFVNKGVHIYPTKNLVKYIGFDDDATHAKTVESDSLLFSITRQIEKISFPLKHPINQEIDIKNNNLLLKAQFRIKEEQDVFKNFLEDNIDKLRESEKIIIYGAGEWGMTLGIELIEKGIRKFEFVVSENRVYKTCLGKAIYSIDDYSEYPNSLLIIAVSNKYRASVIREIEKKQLKRYIVAKSDTELCIDSYMSKELDCNKILLITSVDYAGHGKNIAKVLKSCSPNLEIGWYSTKGDNKNMQGIQDISINDPDNYYEYMYTAKYILTDKGYVAPRADQVVIQLKHWSSVTLKMFGYDELKYRGETDIDKYGVHGWDNIDYLLVGSEFDEKTCRSGFKYDGPAIYVGSPRSDILFDDEYDYSEVINKYSLDKNKKYILYAPTFRIKEPGSVEDVFRNELDYLMLKSTLDKKFGGDWNILLRLHPFVAKQSKLIPKPDYVIDVSDYYDGEELVGISDALITDYSSIMFEPAYINRPVFLFAPDKEKYLSEERGFYINYEELPFASADTNEKLCKNIMEFNNEQYCVGLRKFLDKYGVHEDGKAAKRAADFILNLIEK